MHDWLSICMDRPNQVFPKFCRDVWFPEKTSLIITFVRYYLRTFEGTFVDYLFAKWEGFEVRRYGYHQCLPRSSHGYYLFLWGIDAIICSPLMTCSCTRHSLVFLLIERPFHRLFFGPFVPRWDHYLFGANENVLPSNEDNVWDIIIINRSIWTTKESMDWRHVWGARSRSDPGKENGTKSFS